MQVREIKVDMLGGFSVWVNGQLVVDAAPKLTKPWQLFCYLVLHRDKFVTNRKLIAMLWADDMLTDPANVLKNAVYSLRKELCGGESLTESPIIYSTGGYRFDPAVKLELDVDQLLELFSMAATQESQEEKAKMCHKALNAYKGDFLPQLDQDLWVVPLALEYKQKYMDCAHNLCAILWKGEQHKELLDVATAAIGYEPLDEQTTVYLFRAMNALKMYRVIVTTYFRMAQQYDDSMDGDMPIEAQRIYAAASERINKTEQNIIVIKTELTNTELASRPQRGAYYCSYSNLRHIYALMKRAAERNKQALVLALFSLSAARGVESTQYDLVRAMAEFKVVAMNNLRKTDAIARYSRHQYVMLLSVTSLEDGRLVRDRIKESFAQVATARKMSMDVKLAEV